MKEIKKYFVVLVSSLVFFSFLFTCQSGPATGEAPRVSRKVIIVAKRDGDVATIQEAVNRAGEGDLIRIRAGVYHEAVTIDVPGLTIEAYDPRTEPVFLDGADQTLLETPLVWEQTAENVFSTDYDWPVTPVADREYSVRGGEGDLLQVYENEVLLRGYRDPFDERFFTSDRLFFFGDDRYGLAGAYATTGELNAEDRHAPDPPRAIKPTLVRNGRFFYSAEQKKLFVSPATGESPDPHRYALPVIRHLLMLRAENVTVKNLVFTHSLDYAVTAQAADGGRIEGCLFLNSHFSVSVKATRFFSVANNVIEEYGFWNRYSSDDVQGTMYEKSAIRIEPFGETEEFLIENNIIRGTPFFFTPLKGKMVFSGNIVAYSLFGLFSGGGGSDGGAFSGEFRVMNNVFHHLDRGIAIGEPTHFEDEVVLFRNCFYLASEAFRRETETAAPPHGITFYQNTCVIAGEIGHELFPYFPEGVSRSFNNLFYGNDFGYTVFIDQGEGTPDPVLAGPLLDYNLFYTPLGQNASIGTFTMQGEPYLYRKTRASGTTTRVTGDVLFAPREPLESVAFFHETFDPFQKTAAQTVYENGALAYYRDQRARLLLHFTLDEQSPARNIGRKVPADLPETTVVEDGKPDLGALEY